MMFIVVIIIIIRVFGMHRRTTRVRLKDRSSDQRILSRCNEHRQRVLSENNNGERSSTGGRRASELFHIRLLFFLFPACHVHCVNTAWVESTGVVIRGAGDRNQRCFAGGDRERKRAKEQRPVSTRHTWWKSSALRSISKSQSCRTNEWEIRSHV